MKRLALVSAILLAPASSCPAAEVVVDGRTFRVPDGFVVEKVAGPPLVDLGADEQPDDAGEDRDGLQPGGTAQPGAVEDGQHVLDVADGVRRIGGVGADAADASHSRSACDRGGE